MEATIAQKFDRAVRLLKEASILLEQIRPLVESQVETPRVTNAKDFDKKLRMFLHSDKWPVAVDPARLCDINSDADKMMRAVAILDQVVDVGLSDKRFLDFGCGEGHACFASLELGVSVAVGYDPVRQGWGQFPEIANLVYTTDLSIVDEYAPFDVILMHDVLDHSSDPVGVLKDAMEFLSKDGRLCVKCHPFSSRHGGHNYQSLNRAYYQLFFPEEDGQRVLRPFEEYQRWFKKAGLSIQYERPQYGDVPKFMHITHLADRIKSLYDTDEFPEEHLRVESIVYSLSKQLDP